VRHAVVLAGGQGTRLWPWSRAGRPKQLLPLLQDTSLLDLALQRAAALAGDQVWLAASAELVTAAGGTVSRVAPQRTVVEPSGRDTLAALCLAMRAVSEVDPEAVVAVLTADHVITPQEQLVSAVELGFALAEAAPRTLVTYGVVPDHAATGYGWLELADPVQGGRRVASFREKPALEDAEQMLASGPERFLWNSGMFTWRAADLLAAAEAFAPAHAATASASPGDLDEAAWAALPKLSVDRGVMEPAAEAGSGFTVAAVPLLASWTDVGSWTAFGDAAGRDGDGNALVGEVVVLDAHDCVVASDDPAHLVTLLGVEGLVVVHTAQATLVCRAEDAQRVKELQALVARSHPGHA
jgi:mannose-1-phosphate guanylyltransferase